MNTVAQVDSGDTIHVHVPVELRKRSGRKMVIVPEGTENATVPDTGDRGTLMIALTRAHIWEELIESGRFGSIRELVESIGMDSAYVARIMRLMLLAPGIVKPIALGEEPEGLSYRALAKPFSMLWEEQRTMPGLDGNTQW